MGTVRLEVVRHHRLLRDRLTVAVVDAEGVGRPWLVADVGRLAFRERVTLRGAEDGAPAVVLAGRDALGLGGYDVTGAYGEVLGRVRRHRWRSLLSPVVGLEGPALEAVGRDRGPDHRRARLVDLPSAVGWDFRDQGTGEVVLAVDRVRGRPARCRAAAADPRVDARLAAAVAVAMMTVLTR